MFAKKTKIISVDCNNYVIRLVAGFENCSLEEKNEALLSAVIVVDHKIRSQTFCDLDWLVIEK